METIFPGLLTKETIAAILQSYSQLNKKTIISFEAIVKFIVSIGDGLE